MAKSKPSISRADAERRFVSLSGKVQIAMEWHIAQINARALAAAHAEAADFEKAAVAIAQKFCADHEAATRKLARLKLAEIRAELRKNLGRGTAAQLKQAEAKFNAAHLAADKALLKGAPTWLGIRLADGPTPRLASKKRGRKTGICQPHFDSSRPPSDRGRDRHGDAGDEHSDGYDD